ncbi:tetratricopeptide repeat protein [candidate division WOR-3 bacterium]|nr:tetratricopeptide repeat protein [candidate division WOR-3 bacterium]
MRQAREAFYREDEDEALELLQDGLRLAPTNLHMHYLAALCACLLSEEDTLERVCTHALELDARHPYTLACEAARYLYLANYARAEHLLHRALELLPGELDVQVGLGIVHECAGEQEKGMDAFQRALELDPNNVRARVSLGMAYAMNGEYENALAEYQRAKAADPSIENPHERLGRDYYMDGMIEEAAREFSQAVNEEPDQPAAYFYLMDSCNRLGRTDEALDNYEAIRNRFAHRPDITCGLFEYFRMRTEAENALKELIERNPGDAALRLRLANLYRETGQMEPATTQAEAAARLQPDHPDTHQLLGLLRFERGEYAQAIHACRQAIRHNPYDQTAYITLADSLLFLGRDQESQAAVEEMERTRQEAWRRYQDKFSGQDRADAGF